MNRGKEDNQTCSACGGELFAFEPPASVVGIDRTALPTACRRCGRICVGSTVLPLPPMFQQKVGGIADEAARQGIAAREQLLGDPNARIEKYFDAVYRKGFVDGLARAAAYFTHHAKEGRLRRLRQIWARVRRVVGTGMVEVRMSQAAYSEFNDLIALSASRGNEHAEGPADPGPAG